MTRDLLSGLWQRQELPHLAPLDWGLLLSPARPCRLHARLAWWFKFRGRLPAFPPGPRSPVRAGRLGLGWRPLRSGPRAAGRGGGIRGVGIEIRAGRIGAGLHGNGRGLDLAGIRTGRFRHAAHQRRKLHAFQE